MCFFSGLTRLSMYFSDFCPIGSWGVAWPDFKRPVSAMPVTPGVLSVLQPPFLSWAPRRNFAAFWATASQVFWSGPTLASPAGANERLQPTRRSAMQDVNISLFMIANLLRFNDEHGPKSMIPTIFIVTG